MADSCKHPRDLMVYDPVLEFGDQGWIGFTCGSYENWAVRSVSTRVAGMTSGKHILSLIFYGVDKHSHQLFMDSDAARALAQRLTEMADRCDSWNVIDAILENT